MPIWCALGVHGHCQRGFGDQSRRSDASGLLGGEAPGAPRLQTGGCDPDFDMALMEAL